VTGLTSRPFVKESRYVSHANDGEMLFSRLPVTLTNLLGMCWADLAQCSTAPCDMWGLLPLRKVSGSA